MHRKDLRIGILSDSRNQCIAETYLSLLKGSSFALAHCNALRLDFLHPERATEQLERHHVVLAHVGIPGRHDYQKNLYSFLEAYAAARRKPATGLVTHDADHTRYVIERWLGYGLSPRDLPAGAVTIVDARRPLLKTQLEQTLSTLAENLSGLPAAQRLAIPFPGAQAQSLRRRRTEA